MESNADDRVVRRRRWWRWALICATVVAALVLVHQIGAIDLAALWTEADGPLVGLAAALSLVSLFGAAGSLLAASPVPLPVPATFAVQLATSFTNLITPASAGGNALLIRFVRRNRASLPASVAAVALVQVTGVLGTLCIVVPAVVATGFRIDVHRWFGGAGLLVAAGVVLVLVAVGVWLLRPGGSVRRRIRDGLGETLRQFRKALRQPRRVVGSTFAGLFVLVGQTVTLAVCLGAYGVRLPMAAIALVLSVGTAVGAAAPVPGGIGATEAGLAAGLAVAGADPSSALFAVLLYRVLIFWMRVPLGWTALLWLRRTRHV